MTICNCKVNIYKIILYIINVIFTSLGKVEQVKWIFWLPINPPLFILGKYAQVLQSSSRKIHPTQSLRILKTAAPSLGRGSKPLLHQQNQRHIEPTPSGVVNEEASLPGESIFNAQNSTKSTRKSPGNGGSFKRFKNRHKEPDVSNEDKEQDLTPQSRSGHKKTQKNRSQSLNSRKWVLNLLLKYFIILVMKIIWDLKK